ncbi:MAG: enoyl-CoA hydratase-related protein [Gammaproteobacteria bacterium]|nr:enoyl-CoA hydratase-related protein [Gammaproteobacteria bacterium]
MAENLLISTDERGICTIKLNRPEVHNAFEPDLIENLSIQLTFAADDDYVRAIVITGSGKTFSSGADINWMRSMIKYDHTTNSMDAMKMAQMLHKLYTLPKPTIALVNGSAYGGALGIIACCDIALANSNASFAFTEVKLGIVPAVVSPYVVSAIGHRNARRLFLTADNFNAGQALQMGLLHKVVEPDALDEALVHELDLLLGAGPSAQHECKRLLHKLTGIADDVSEYTAELIAQIRISEEGQEGLLAFLEKRKPSWFK